jgi:predicted signal transduction protein with EAL and GGDEF domain
MLSADAQAITNRRIDEVIHLVDPDNFKAASNLVGQSAHHGRVFKRDKPCSPAQGDGSICYIVDVVSPVLNEAGVLTGLVIVLQDATADMQRERDLEHRALHDPLTGLSNRADFTQRLQRTFRRASQTERPAAVVAIDLRW